jgi:hypothetical protein
MWETKYHPSRSRNKACALTTFIQHTTRSPSDFSKAEKEKKRHTNSSGRNKTASFADDMIVYIENLYVPQVTTTILFIATL